MRVLYDHETVVQLLCHIILQSITNIARFFGFLSLIFVGGILSCVPLCLQKSVGNMRYKHV